MRLRIQLAAALAALLLAGSLSIPAVGQRGAGQGKARMPPPRGENAYGAPVRSQAEIEQENRARVVLGLPPLWMERLREMSPEEQERFLNNNERFQKLPPMRQAQIRKRLQHWNSLTPTQRQAVRERERVWQQMPPDQQRQVREELLPRWQQLSPDRRQAILQHLHALRSTSPAGRTAKLDDPGFVADLTPDERVMLRELVKLRGGLVP